MAQKVIATDGLRELSIRRIGRDMNCNTGNIYYYFKNLNELITYATMPYMSEYVHALSECVAGDNYTAESYERSCCCYMDYSFRNPEIFKNLIFGPCSTYFGDIARDYFEIFPEESLALDPKIVKTLTDTHYDPQSDNLLLSRFVEAGVFSAEDAPEFGRIVIGLNLGCLQHLIDHPDMAGGVAGLSERYRKDIHSLIEHYKIK